MTDVALAAVKNIRNQLLLYAIVETVLLGVLLAVGTEVPGGLAPVVYAIACLILIVAAGHFLIEYRTLVTKSAAPTETRAISRPQNVETFAASDSREFRNRVEALILAARHVVLIGTGLNLLNRDPFAREVILRAAHGDCRLEIYLADPASPRVRMRLAEEELGNYKPPVGRKGLEIRLTTLLAAWRSAGRPSSIKIGLFSHYLTMATLLIDDDYFVYPYGFATLGNFSPVLYLSKTNPANAGFIEFLELQYQLVKEHSIDAETVVVHRSKKRRRFDQLVPFALYYVPPAESALYEFGTKVLGYDIRDRQLIKSPWSDDVGSAAAFGFHLTLADALYFFTEAEVRAVVADLEIRLQDFASFDVGNFRICERFPDKRSVSLRFDDNSGSLEALHHELVHCAYSLAAESDYSLGRAALTRDSDSHRAATMIKHYQAPYILGRFQPHFTLATNVEHKRQGPLRAEVEKFAESKQLESTVRIARLAVMSRDPGRDQWVIIDELTLG